MTGERSENETHTKLNGNSRRVKNRRRSVRRPRFGECPSPGAQVSIATLGSITIAFGAKWSVTGVRSEQLGRTDSIIESVIKHLAPFLRKRNVHHHSNVHLPALTSHVHWPSLCNGKQHNEPVMMTLAEYSDGTVMTLAACSEFGHPISQRPDICTRIENGDGLS